jgi:hypothetical protein
MTIAAPPFSEDVKGLQQALATYATTNNYPPANPGPETGIVDIPTTMAVVATIPRIPGIPAEIAVLTYTIGPLMISEEGRNKVFTLIHDHAKLITSAIVAIQVVATPTPPPIPETKPPAKPMHALAPMLPGANVVWAPPSIQPPLPLPPRRIVLPTSVKIAGAIGLGLAVAGGVILIRRQRRRARAAD